MNLRARLDRLVPNSLFARLVTVWLLSYLLLRLVSFGDITLRADYLYLRVMADIEARFIALHMRLLGSESARTRDKLVRQLGRDKELWISKSSVRQELPEEDSAISRELTAQLQAFLSHSSYWKGIEGTREVRASLLVWPKGQEKKPRHRRPDSFALSEIPFALSAMMEQRSAQARVSVSLSDGDWLNFVHNVDTLPDTVLYFSLNRLLLESLVMAILALSTIFWIVRPLKTLAVATEAFGRDMNTPPLPEQTGSSEIRNAARAFNSMREHIVSFVRQRATVLAAVSHDLRTPLTRMRLRLERMEDDALRQALLADVDEVQHSLHMAIQSMRTLDSGEMKPDRVDFMALLESMVDDCLDMGQPVALRGCVHGSYWLSPIAVKRCLENVLHNALRYGVKTGRNEAAPEGEASPDAPAGNIGDPADQVFMEARLENGMLCVDVLDNGPGIPENRQEMVFEPFYRLEDSRNPSTGGFGLGLYIARKLARQCGGDVILTNRPEGGLCARVTFAARPV